MTREPNTFSLVDLVVLESAQKYQIDQRGSWSAHAIQCEGWPNESGFKAKKLGITKSIQRLIRLGYVKRTKYRGSYLLTDKGLQHGND